MPRRSGLLGFSILAGLVMFPNLSSGCTRGLLIFFTSGSSEIAPVSARNLTDIASGLRSIPVDCPIQFHIEGHMDARESLVPGNEVDQQRIAAVAEFLSASGVGHFAVIPIPMGSRHPLVFTPAGESEPMNRRSRLVIRSDFRGSGAVIVCTDINQHSTCPGSRCEATLPNGTRCPAP